MDELQKNVINATKLYPEVLKKHATLKRVMADVFGNERIKGNAFCLAFGLGIVEACTLNYDSLIDIFDSLKDDYSIDDEIARWVIFTWCEIYNLKDYERYLKPASSIDMLDSLFGDAVEKIGNYVSQQQEIIAEEKKREKEKWKLKLLQARNILEKYNKYRDGLETTDAIELYKSLFMYLKNKNIILDSVVVEKSDNQRLTVSASEAKMIFQGKINGINIDTSVNSCGVKFPKTDKFEEKKAFCKFLEDTVTAKETLEGLKLIVNFVAQNNFDKCEVIEKGLVIKGIRVNMDKNKFYYGNQVI